MKLDWNRLTANDHRELAPLYDKVRSVISPIEWVFHAPYIKAINDLKKERNAVILAHNYQTPEIYHCVADFVGDSLQLAKEAQKTKADVIVQAGVYFMAETSKILNPEKTVLIPDVSAGCSLAESIKANDIRAIRAAWGPNVPIVAYVNTSAEVKAEVDICCTSANAVRVVESLGRHRVIMVPDRFLARNVQKQTKVEIIPWDGTCIVHDRFNAEEIKEFKSFHDGLVVLSHPECPSEVVEASDFSGSTSGMIDYIKTKKPEKVMLLTECSMASNIATETPDTRFISPCNLCPHMKRITLPKILDALVHNRTEVLIEPEIISKAQKSIQRMIDVG